MSCKRVQDIIRRQFSVDIEKKQNELEEVEEVGSLLGSRGRQPFFYVVGCLETDRGPGLA